MKFYKRGNSGHWTVLALVGVLSIGACAANPDGNTTLDRIAYEDVSAIMNSSQFSFVGRVESSEGTWYHPIWEDDPNLNPLATGDSSRSAEDLSVQMAPIAVTEYTFTIIDPLSSNYKSGESAAVFQIGGSVDGEENIIEDLNELQIGDEYLLFIWDQTDPGYWTITGIDAGIFSKATNGENFQNQDGLTIDGDSLKQLTDLSFYSKNIRK